MDASTGSSAPSGSQAENAQAPAGATGKAADGMPPTATAQLIQAASAIPRKIIYNATVDLISDNFPAAQNSLLALIQKNKGYIADTDISGTPGKPRQGTWKIRIPLDEFASFMNSVVKLGELQTTHTDSQDVTAEFYDLQTRIANKQVEERRLLDHLQHSTAKLSDILQVEHEIGRVRGEIEQMQGQLRLMANVTSLTTITVTIHEVKGYTAPKPTTFGTQVARSFQDSLAAMLDVGKGVVLLLVTVLPWIVLLGALGIPFWFLGRRFFPK